MRLIRISVYISLFVLSGRSVTAQEWFEPIAAPTGGIANSLVMDSTGMLFVSIAEHGVYRSSDFGDTWEPTALRQGFYFPLIVMGDGTVWASPQWPTQRASNWILTTDMGDSWISPEAAGRSDPGNGEISIGGKTAVHTSNNGSLLSTNHGITWDSIPSLPGVRDCLVLDDSTIIACMRREVLRTEDRGHTWFSVLSDTNLIYSGIGSFGDSVYVHAAVDRDFERRLFLSDRTTLAWDSSRKVPFVLMKLIRFDTRWWFIDYQRYPSWWEAPYFFSTLDTSGNLLPTPLGDVHAYAGLPHPDGGMLFATDAGIVHYTPETEQWTPRNRGLPPRQILSLLEPDQATLLVGTAFGGLYQSKRDAWEWTSVGLFPSPISILHRMPDGSITAGGSFVRPFPQGILWCDRPGPLYVGSPMEGNWQHADSVWDGLRDLSVGDDGSLLATNIAEVLYSNGMTDSVEILHRASGWCGSSLPYSFIERTSDERLFCRLNDYGFLSTDGGVNWSDRPYLQGIRRISPTAILKLERGYLTRSTDDGEHWELLPLPQNIRAQLLSAGDGVALVSGTPNGLGAWQDCYIILAEGDSIRHVVLDPERYGIFNCALLASDGYLYAGTSMGLFRSRQPLTSLVTERGFVLGQHFPNPATGTITVPYEIRREGRPRMTILDITGREAWVLEVEWHAFGSYEVVIPVDKLRKGTYFIRLEHEGEMMMKKLRVAAG
jgi:hypothetical protein